MRKQLIRKGFALAILMVIVLVFVPALYAASEADQAAEKQKQVMDVITSVPGPGWIIGFFTSWYKAGEMQYAEEYIRAVREGRPKPAGNETGRGLLFAGFKGLSTAPEGIAFYGVGRTLRLLAYDQLDPYSVWTAYGRHYVLDGLVIGAKASMGALGAYAADVGLPLLGGAEVGGEVIAHSFLWNALAGGTLNVLTGTANQALQGATPFSKYYAQHQWWSGRKPL